MLIKMLLKIIIVVSTIQYINCALPDPGKYDFDVHDYSRQIILERSLFSGSQIFLQITCEPFVDKEDLNVTIVWSLIRSVCWDIDEASKQKEKLEANNRNKVIQVENQTFLFVQSTEEPACSGHVILNPVHSNYRNAMENSVFPHETKDMISDSNKKNLAQGHPKSDPGQCVYEVDKDGLYVLIIQITAPDKRKFNASIHIEMVGKTGYLSAVDWPLLPFYASMCFAYVIFGVIWLLVSFLEWRNLLRIQFWIGGVILLGMLEKATFYAEYQSVNTTGINVQGAMVLAEWVSCGKRTLARMLVIIVSLGFGIVKPRLGPMFHRVVGAGILYFLLAAIESYLRIMHKQNDRSREILIAGIPLAILDSAICWWIFTSLVQTTRTLRLRRNTIKLNLYKHFTNTLIFSVIASVIFMIYSIRAHKLAICLTDWKELWVDEAYWHILFSVILLVIMVLWRPTNNNQRYAFTPLLDNPEDEDSTEEDQFISDAYGVKVRFHNRSSQNHDGMSSGGGGGGSGSKTKQQSTSIEDDIRWVEENIPAAISEPTLPILDSEEEIMNTKFEVSKMQ